MGVLVTVIDDGLALDALFGDWQGDLDDTIWARTRRERSNLQRIEGFARIAIRDFGQVPQGGFFSVDAEVAKPALWFGQSAPKQRIKLLFAERAQLKDLRAGNQR